VAALDEPTEARDLALLARARHSWMRVLNEGGGGLPHDPLPVLGAICQGRRGRRPGRDV
jgi:hypothetical protein